MPLSKVVSNSLSLTTLTASGAGSIQGLTVGRGAGAVATNTAFGVSALAANTTGSLNTAVGNEALKANTTGDYNTAMGSSALLANTTGPANSAFGLNALYYNTTGGYNTGLGVQALNSNTTASNNTAVGYQAGYNNTTGGNLVATGYRTLYSNTTGNDNNAFGWQTLYANTTGSNNTAVGSQALYANTTASRNTAVGYLSLTANTTGTRNTALGAYSLYVATTGNFNTAVGDVALEGLTTGSYNTAVGIGSGGAITTGSKNTIIGGYTGNQGSLDIRTLSNRIVISDGDGNPRIYVNEAGATFIRGIDLAMGGISPSIFRNTNSSCSGFHFTAPGAYPVDGNGSLNDNVMPLGNGSYRMSVIFAGTGTISTSDANEKQDIESLSDAELRVAKVIKGLMKKYRWKDAVAIKGDEARIHVGVIAQDIEAAFAAEGLDAHRYAMFCSDTSYRVNGQAMDKDGNWHTPETEGAVKFTRLGVRYDQVLAFLIAAM